jgi:glucokinase
MSKTPVTLGIDIGGTNTVFSFIDFDGNEIKTAQILTRGQEPAENLVRRLHEAIQKNAAGLETQYELKGIGIGAPNANYYRGTVEHPPNLNWEIVPLVKLVQKYYHLPTAITNDANAAALGEKMYGAARDMKDFIVITLGTGLGSGIVIDNRLVYGADGFAGELGHTTVFPDGRLCGCGKNGCLETYASAGGLCRTALMFMAEETAESSLRTIPPRELTSEIIAHAAREGDPIAKKTFQYTGRILGMKLADAVVFSSPQAIFLFGGLVNSGKLIFEPVKKYMEHFLPPIFRNRVQLLPSGLQGKNIAVLGAGALILNEINTR